eukprot:scaffold6740_cov126-Isochrysis_galbana.AAC.2
MAALLASRLRLPPRSVEEAGAGRARVPHEGASAGWRDFKGFKSYDRLKIEALERGLISGCRSAWLGSRGDLRVGDIAWDPGWAVTGDMTYDY